MNRNARARCGLTLVEVLIVTMSAALVLGLGLEALAGTSRALVRSEERLDAREIGAMTLAAVRAAVQGAWQYQVLEGRGLLFQAPGGQGTILFDPRERRVAVVEPGSRDVRHVGAGQLIDFGIVSAAPGELLVSITVARRTLDAALFLEDSIAVPAILQKQLDVPFTTLMASPFSERASY